VIEFWCGQLHGQGIILEQPTHGVGGIVECASAGCAQKLVLTVEHGHGDPNRLAAAIDHFMCTHECGRAACQA